MIEPMKKISHKSSNGPLLHSNPCCEQHDNVDLKSASLNDTPKRGNDEQKLARVQFPSKLRNILEDAEKEKFDDIIAWLPDGLAFRILNPQEFAKKILPLYFSHANYRSFQRSLYHYQFSTIRNGQTIKAYSHPKFNRKDKHQSPKFFRKKKPKLIKQQDTISFMSPFLSRRLMKPPYYSPSTATNNLTSYVNGSKCVIEKLSQPLPTNMMLPSRGCFLEQRFLPKIEVSWLELEYSPDHSDAFNPAMNVERVTVSLGNIQEDERVVTSHSERSDRDMNIVSPIDENESFVAQFEFPLSDDLEPTPLLENMSKRALF